MKNVVSAYIERWNLVLGVIFIAIITFMPEGLVPGSVRLWRLFRQKLWPPRSVPAPAPAGERP
jgi:branched-chain amino acid transport system permease protein